MILSWSFFERRFNGDPAILGKTIRLNSQTYTVIGVLPDWFQYPDPKIQMWVPWQIGVSARRYLTHYNPHRPCGSAAQSRAPQPPRPFRKSAPSSTSSTLGTVEQDRWRRTLSRFRCSKTWWAT